VVDLANALATTAAGGSLCNLGNLTLTSGGTTKLATFVADDNFYSSFGGILEVRVTESQWNARHAPLSLVTDNTGIGGPALWNENSPVAITADLRSVRITSDVGSPDSTVTCPVWVGNSGEPYVGAQLQVEVVSVVNGIKGATVPWSAGYKGNTRQAEGAVTATVTPADSNGWAQVTLNAVQDPGMRDDYLDGQLYFIVPYMGTKPDLTKAPAAQEVMISCVALSRYAPNENPTWNEVESILEGYVRLFPFMTSRIDMSDPHTFQIFATNPPWVTPNGPTFNPSAPVVLPNGKKICIGAIPYYLTRPLDDPRCMPLTRDLSPGRLATVLYYCLLLQGDMQGLPPCN
jgi:hypothetical protein